MAMISQGPHTRSISPPEAVPGRAFEQPPARGDGMIGGRSRSLPVELEFVRQHGVSTDRLLSALDAAPLGVGPLDAILREGVIQEEDYYQALAQHLGCEYYFGEPSFGKDFDVLKGLRCGVAPLAARGRGPRAVIAPRASSVSRLIEMTKSGRLHPESFAVASPQRFASFVRMQRGDAVLDDALGRLASSLSARRGMNGAQIAAAGLIASSAFAVAAANIHVLTAVLSLALWLVFSSSIALRSAAAIANDDKVPPRMPSDDELPVYTVVAAVYREAEVIRDLVEAFDALDYPKSKLDIKLVAERRDEETLSRLLAMRLPARYEVIVAPPGEPCTKPRALNIALAAAQGDLLAVYDAEDAPSPDQLRLAASRFATDGDLDCLQARLTVRNADDSWLSKLFAVEYAVLFDLINPGLCALELPIALGGTSNHFRVSALMGVGRWDEWNVAEDADLGIRLARYGYKIGSLNSDTSEEAPYEFRNWFWQRVRWQKGWMQTCIVHSREPSGLVGGLGRRQAFAAAVLIFGSVLSALFWPAFAFDTLRRAFEAAGGVSSGWREASDVFTYLLAFAGIWAMLVPAIVAARLRGLNLSAKTLALMPLYYVLVSIAAWTAIFDLALRPHFWAKTEHGRARPPAGPAPLADPLQLGRAG
jgi:cellulose synthase/poly-beta-1,6-N-acetylglucosamine synthase-like glycosyltransferase